MIEQKSLGEFKFTKIASKLKFIYLYKTITHQHESVFFLLLPYFHGNKYAFKVSQFKCFVQIIILIWLIR